MRGAWSFLQAAAAAAAAAAVARQNKARTFLVLRKHTLMLKNTFEKGCLIKEEEEKKNWNNQR